MLEKFVTEIKKELSQNSEVQQLLAHQEDCF